MIKQILAFGLSLIIVGLAVYSNLNPKIYAAGGFGIGYSIAQSAGSVVANGSASVTITVNGYSWMCGPGLDNGTYVADPNTCAGGSVGAVRSNQAGQPVNVTISGSGNTITPSSTTTDAGGNAVFTIKSTVVETKTLQIYAPIAPGPAVLVGTKTVSFTAPVTSSGSSSSTPSAPAAAAKATTAAPTATPTTTPTPTPAAAAQAALPVMAASVQVAGANVKSTDKPTVKSNEPVELSGKTVPNGVVSIYVFSTPKKYTVTADKDGNWSYKVAGLPVGDHHIEATVTDPATGKTSAQVKVLAFTVSKAATATKQAASVSKSSNNSNLGAALGVSLFIIFAGVVGFLLLHKRKSSQQNIVQTKPEITSNTPPVGPIPAVEQSPADQVTVISPQKVIQPSDQPSTLPPKPPLS